MSGDCFEVAARLVALGDPRLSLDLGDRDEARVVHGLPREPGTPSTPASGTSTPGSRSPTGRASPRTCAGRTPELLRLLDEAGELETVIVIDRSNGLDVALPRAAYYALGGLDEGQVWQFPVIEARLQMKRRGHYGPWVDDWEPTSQEDIN